ncbi:5'-methylthioadenosine phosphorylase [Allocatelliglobosispora scoriae]|uniref:Purine nucleoside phosphorylase n=1 Tax=Allocatelliglobosispora scoriae TaxID=643052 RepID=A0A841BXY5_9ACTN|nr:S-methyl-5'-thioadenosine phosphorylase [Allocatelliglobosispora scoriae]MBB5873024.1 5'-methylthioadenosine phosphorylase [Allocatelliglobosispora scoriae]
MIAPDVAVIGGSGFYSLLDGAEEVVVETPFGAPSDAVTVGTVGERRVAFLPRHGRDHSVPPHRINYRANLWALRSLGCRQVLAPCAVGALDPALVPGTIVLPDQVVDRTTGREQTFFDTGAVHVPFADPYCATGRGTVAAVASRSDRPAVERGTMVVIPGPRFSSRAESRWYAAQGFTLVNMTGLPEAALARELALCYTAIALVTDLDAGIDGGHESVSQAEVFRVFAENTERLRAMVLDVVTELPTDRTCACADAHEGITLPFPLP